MKERPIIMTAESVRAILDGRKTQTRRIATPEQFGMSTFAELREDLGSLWARFSRPRHPRFGERGDRLWVKERWDYFGGNEYLYQQQPEAVIFRADERAEDTQRRWRTPLFMPRWASRLTLEVVEVRVQRLQDISEEDARAEGCTGSDPEPAAEGGTIYAWHGRSSAPCPRAHYLTLWDRINAKRAPWASNPWVWAITFARVP